MDRHDIPEAITAEHVAQMHREDLKIEHLYGCKGMTYWCDEKRRTAFCLIQAPNMKAIEAMHDHAHGDVPHRIIEVESAIVESFLGRIEDPEKSQKTELNIINDPAFRTIMIIKLHKSPSFTSTSIKLNTFITNANGYIINAIEKFLGRIVQQKSDYFLGSFTSVTNAVLCAKQIQSLLQNSLKGFEDDLTFHIGLNAGVPVTDKEKIFEDTIRLAERLCYVIRKPIVMTSEVKELYESENLNTHMDERVVHVVTANEEKFLTGFLDLIDKEWDNPTLRAASLEKKLGLSKSQLYRKLMATIGTSPNEFIKAYRLNNALALLLKGADTISEIAYKTGFNSPAYFSKCFADKFGILPSKIEN
jgi:AraC-like DNA-binding protein